MDTKKGFIRKTKQRDLILKTLRSTTCHPTADWIYEKVKREMPNISLGTVYRNLGMLKELGEIIELDYGSKQSRYDGNPQNHYHFVCVECEKVIDVKSCEVDKQLEKCVAIENDVEVLYHRTEFYGLCEDCKNKKAKQADVN
ncbi:MAG: Fur family transcriptional regulator [Tepidanaerobacteraceae bacterium]|jgi:Fur family peroxide stress response transcriptional regulator|nr:transcriptional repressor [Thermoanaerobacterales bacterium]